MTGSKGIGNGIWGQSQTLRTQLGCRHNCRNDVRSHVGVSDLSSLPSEDSGGRLKGDPTGRVGLFTKYKQTHVNL